MNVGCDWHRRTCPRNADRDGERYRCDQLGDRDGAAPLTPLPRIREANMPELGRHNAAPNHLQGKNPPRSGPAFDSSEAIVVKLCGKLMTSR